MPDLPVSDALVLDVCSTLVEHGHDVFRRAPELRAVLAAFLGSSDVAGDSAPLS